MLIYTHQKSVRKKPSAKQLRLREERKTFFAAILKNKTSREKIFSIPEPLEVKSLPPLSNTIGNGFKRSVDDYKWKRDREESVETIKEIERKKTKVAPAFNKGAVQYITDDTDPTHLGRKL